MWVSRLEQTLNYFRSYLRPTDPYVLIKYHILQVIFTADWLTSGGWEIPGHIPYTHGDHGECGEVVDFGDSEPVGHYPLKGKSYR